MNRATETQEAVALLAIAVMDAGGLSHVPNEEQSGAQRLIAKLYALSDELSAERPDAAELIGEAAAMLDAYQAGLILVTPHALTGYVLRRAGA